MKLSASLFTLLSTIGAANAVSKYDKHSPLQAHPMPPVPKPYQVEYDDGTKSPMMRLKIRGDEEGHHLIYEETLDGYTVGPSAKHGGKYTYLDVDMHTGELVDTGLVFGQDNPNSKNVHKGAATKSDALKIGIAHPDARGLKGGPTELFEEEGRDNNRRTAITSGLLKNLVVPMRFSDHASRALPTRADLDVLMNNEGPATQCPTGSVRDVFTESSFGQLDIQSTVVDWVTLDFTEAYCANGNSGLSSRIHECLTNALDKVAATGVDFRDYDLDGNGRIDGITFFHSGYAAEWGGTDGFGTSYTNRIWSHKWAIWSTNWSNNGVRVYEYHINPSLWARSGSSIGRIGVVAHETGHFLGLPDLYDYGDATFGDGEGIGSWGLMANSWGFDGSQFYPPIMSAWGKYVLGWTNPTEVSTSGTYSLGQSCDSNEMIIISEGYPSGEYLLIENRQPCGFESRMPQGGLAIFHIDDRANNVRGYPGQTGWPENGNHYEVALLQADATYGLERGFNRGDNGDMFHAGGVTSIGPDGTSTGEAYPNTKAYQGGSIVDTEVTISNIGAAGARMTFDITIGSDAATPTASPTKSPTKSPTSSPTKSPTAAPTSSPTASPTISPTASPTKSPTAAPTSSPTSSPTRSPNKAPTKSPTSSPTSSPTASPTRSPNKAPTKSPTAAPTSSPTSSPTRSPTKSPVATPSSDYVEVFSDDCESFGYETINSSGECSSAAAAVGRTVTWGPHGGYNDVVDGCSARFRYSNTHLFFNSEGVCDPNAAVGHWTYTGCKCTDWMPCICRVPSNNGICQDYPNAFRVTMNNGKSRFKDCDWVGGAPARCELAGVKATCPLTCGTCSTCEDSPLKLRVFTNGRRRHKFCSFVAKKPGIRCDLSPAYKIGCRETCGQC